MLLFEQADGELCGVCVFVVQIAWCTGAGSGRQI